MRNYVRYIILLVLIIAGGLLIISVVNKFSEPDVSKVDNKKQTEQIRSDEDGTDLDIDSTDDGTSSTDEGASDASTLSTDTGIQTGSDSVSVPNTASDHSKLFIVLGFTIIVTGVGFVKKNIKAVNN